MATPVTANTSAYDLIKLALKTAGVLAIGQTPEAEDTNDALTVLNSMVASWNQNRWLVYHLVDVHAPSTGAQSYSVGPTGTFQVTRPDRLQSAYVRLMNINTGVQTINGIDGTTTVSGSGPVDYPLSIIDTSEEYGNIGIKSLRSFPASVFYDASLNEGTVYFWPIPNNNFELHIIVKETLQEFPNLTTVINLPPEYFEALFYNLTGRLQLLYQLPVNPGVATLASAGLNQIRIANHRVAKLKMPVGVNRHGGWANHGVGGIIEGTFTLNQDVLGG